MSLNKPGDEPLDEAQEHEAVAEARADSQPQQNFQDLHKMGVIGSGEGVADSGEDFGEEVVIEEGRILKAGEEEVETGGGGGAGEGGGSGEGAEEEE